MRFCAVRWATSLFGLQHCPSRYICMLGAADTKLDIRSLLFCHVTFLSLFIVLLGCFWTANFIQYVLQQRYNFYGGKVHVVINVVAGYTITTILLVLSLFFDYIIIHFWFLDDHYCRNSVLFKWYLLGTEQFCNLTNFPNLVKLDHKP